MQKILAISYGGGNLFKIEGHFVTVDSKATVILDRTTWAHK